MQYFEKDTRQKANGRTRVLLVDGHNSHYTRAYLEHARAHNIHVLCYPAHSTHVYQGLDVAVFSYLKACWSEERDRWEREKGEKVSKENFLAVYGAAHLRAMKPDIIASAFRKTGIWPFDRDVITTKMMAPSKESSCEGDLPLIPSTPVRIVGKLLRQALRPEASTLPNSEDVSAVSGNSSQSLSTTIKSALTDLASTSTGFLFNPTPIKSTDPLPMLPVTELSPAKSRHPVLLEFSATTEKEKELQNALREAEMREACLKGKVMGLQTAVILQDVYLGRTRSQLAAKEKKNKTRANTKVIGDGMPRLVTGSAFYNWVDTQTQAQEDEEAAKEVRRVEREAQKRAVEEWAVEEQERKSRNDAITAKWKNAVAEWVVERDLAKEEHRRPRWKKPVRGPVERPIPRPKAPSAAVEDDETRDEGDEIQEEISLGDVEESEDDD